MKKLAILGASYLQLSLVKKAKEMGIQTHCFAWSEGAVCKEECDFFYDISTLEMDKILKKCKEIGIDGIVTIASDIAVPAVCYVAEKLSLIGNNFSDSFASTNKYLMRKQFVAHNVSSPAFVHATNMYDPLIIDLTFPLIVKPTDRSGSRGVTKINNKEQWTKAIERALSESISHTAIVEEYIIGDEVSVETISWEGTHYILAITDKVTTGEPYFVEIEHHQPSMLDSEIQEKIKSETIKALNSLNHKYGASHSEFKITNEGKVIAIEVGARMGGDFIGSDLVRLSTGYDFLKATIDVALGNFSAPTFRKRKCSGVYFIGKATSYIQKIIKEKSIPEIVSCEIFSQDLKDLKCSDDRTGYFIYQDDKKVTVKEC
jgi:biotin carboxylase